MLDVTKNDIQHYSPSHYVVKLIYKLLKSLKNILLKSSVGL